MNNQEIKNFRNDINTITNILVGGSITVNKYNSKCDSTIDAYSITYNMSKAELRDILKK